jgi:hypothetical protein
MSVQRRQQILHVHRGIEAVRNLTASTTWLQHVSPTGRTTTSQKL